MSVDQKTLTEWLTYDPDTGKFFWAKKPERSSHRRDVGKEAGCNTTGGSGKHKSPRRVLHLQGKRIYAARAAWIMSHGDIPKTVLIDHIDGDTLNDRLSNLRPLGAAANTWNRAGALKSEFSKGVSLNKAGSFISRITAPDGRKINLGSWKTEAEARAAYLGASAVIHGEYSLLYRPNKSE